MVEKGLYKKLLKNKELMDDVLPEDEKTEFLSTGVITLNLLFSGLVDGGIPVGKLSQIAAPSTLGKTFIGLSTLKSAQRDGFYSVVIDTERAFDFNWARQLGIDTNPEKLMVIQGNFIEKVQKQILTILDGLSREERKKVFVLLDSFGGLVTSKTFDNAIKENDKADFTIPKKKNNFAKLLMGTGVTGFVVNHVYDNIGGFGDPMSIPGGRGLEFACSCIVLASSKAKEKNSAKDITGLLVTAKTAKSRFGKENSKLKFRIKTHGGLDVFYGLLNDAQEFGVVDNPTKGYYTRGCVDKDKKWREKDIYTTDWWLPIFKGSDFQMFLEDKYSFRNQQLDVTDVDIKNDLVTDSIRG